ncbi:MAG: hypothetical protein AB7P40_31880 [Chloroflexota bacterium]
MPRTSRSVAQRLAAQQSSKSKKRRAPRPTEPAQAPAPTSSSVGVDQILDEVVPSEGGPRTASTPMRTSPTPTPSTAATGRATARRGTAATATRTTTRAPRRRYHEYAAEYQYVWTDLRRIVIVASILIVLLIALAFIIN